MGVTRENRRFPLGEFIATLREHGFIVSPGQIAESYEIVAFYAARVNDEKALGNYLRPIFARNQKEQENFNTLFERYFYATETTTEIVIELGGKLEEKEPVTRKLILLVLAIILVALAIISVTVWLRPKKRMPFAIQLVDADQQAKLDRGALPFQSSTKEELRLIVQSSFSKENQQNQNHFRWDDGLTDTLQKHHYAAAGKYQLAVKIHRNESKIYQPNDTAFKVAVRVCDFTDSLKLASDQPGDMVGIGRQITFFAALKGSGQGQLHWLVNGKPAATKTKDTLRLKFPEKGLDTVTAKVTYPGKDTLCNLSKSIQVIVKKPTGPKPEITREENIKDVYYSTDYRLITILAFFLSTVIAAFCAILFYLKKRNDPVNKAFRQFVNSLSGDQPPLSVKFPDQQALINTDLLLDELIWTMRQRQLTGAYILNIKQTIKKTAASRGLIQPVQVSRTKQTEYLILLDRSAKAGVQAVLFSWLLQLMQYRNVFISWFDYDADINLIADRTSGKSSSLRELSERFPESILLIWGDGSQLIEADFPVFRQSLIPVLAAWTRRVLITPNLVSDWGYAEKNLIPPVMPIVPANTSSLLHYFKNPEHDFANSVASGSRLSLIEFDEITGLRSYCAGFKLLPAGSLLQWLAALAVYPRLNWELLLALGKAIFKNYGEESRLSFEVLLWVTRIPWVCQMAIPDYLRLELLKELTPNNELIVRQTVLILLREIKADDLNERHFAYEEQQFELITNEFILYAADPERYAQFKPAMILFKMLWQKGIIKDVVSKTYLRNEQMQWETLVSDQRRNIRIADYFKQQKTDKKFNILYYLVLLPLLLLLSMTLLFSLSNKYVPAKNNWFKKGQVKSRIITVPATDTGQRHIIIVPDTNRRLVNIDTGKFLPPPPPFDTILKRINHIVVICLTGHSFDNLYGQFPGANGIANVFRTNIPQVDSAGQPYAYLPPVPRSSVFPTNLPNNNFNIDQYLPNDQVTPDLTRRYYQEQMQINSGKMNKFVLYNNSRGLAMGYYKTELLPLYTLAQQYVLCDNFFHSAFGSSFLNYQWMISAKTPLYENSPLSQVAQTDRSGRLLKDGVVTPDGFVVNTANSINTPHPVQSNPTTLVPTQINLTIGDLMSAKQVNWAWYSGGWDNALAGKAGSGFQYEQQPFIYYKNYGDGSAAKKEHLKDEKDFIAAAKAGTLPAVSFVKPLGEFSEHPGISTVQASEAHALTLIQNVMKGPNWHDTFIIVTYDSGGSWDHVAPPVIDKWGPGTRVPTLIISPLVKPGYVDHMQYETVSILSLIEARWGLSPLSSRDANALPFSNAFKYDANFNRKQK